MKNNIGPYTNFQSDIYFLSFQTYAFLLCFMCLILFYLHCIPTRITNTAVSLLDNIFSSLTLVQKSTDECYPRSFSCFLMYDFFDSLIRGSQGAGFSSLIV